jgi:hypothetical protein
LDINKGVILSLCDFTGNWSRPYAEAGYEVVRIDLQDGVDVRMLRHIERRVHGILMAPPCTHFSRAGAHLWKTKGEGPILDGLAVVDACLRTVAIYSPTWWVLENPIGRIKDYLGPPKWKFDPYQFGDAWTKRTWLWGNFTPPVPLFSAQPRKEVDPEWSAPGGISQAHHDRDVKTKPGRPLGSIDRTTWLGSRRKVERSATPEGFAKAFFEVNP